MTATEVLRRMLDERGVEYFKHEDGEPLRKLEKADKPATSWRLGNASVCAVPIDGSDLFDLWIDHCTPEQAVAATLGAGTCKVESMHGYTDAHTHTSWCVELSCHTLDAWEDSIPPSYCPICGARVVE